MISNTEERRDIRFKYHSPVPNSYRIPNPSKPLRNISDEVFEEFKDMAFEIGVAGLSYSKLSDDFKAEWNIDFDNVIILKNGATINETLNSSPVLTNDINNRYTLTSTVILSLNAGDVIQLGGTSLEDILYTDARMDIEKIK